MTTDSTSNSSTNSTLFKNILAVLVLIVLSMGATLWVYRHWFAPATPKVEVMTTQGVLKQIQQLNRLETVAYHVATVVTSRKEGSWNKLWQDQQKGLFVVSGRVIAGLDLSKLTAQQVQVSADGKTIHIQLPAVEIFSTNLDKIELYDIQTGLFGLVDVDPQIFSSAQAAARQQIYSTACQGGVLKTANLNAQKHIQTLFALTQAQVTVSVAPLPSCPQ